jgi:FkbM family methyltransferase
MKVVNCTGHSVVKSERLRELEGLSRLMEVFDPTHHSWPIISALSGDCGFRALAYLAESKSQLHQDLFVLAQTALKRKGYFVEFGASDGVTLANTHLLEKAFGWTGILAEPARGWYPALSDNRSAAIEKLCVYSKTGETVTFNETSMKEYSTIDAYGQSDLHAESRKSGMRYEVKTISLADLLTKHKAPRYIDYLSIDTEGSELKILQDFDFNHWTFGIVTIEHNYTAQREAILLLLQGNGYRRWKPEVTEWDDWYVNEGAIRRNLLR